MSNIPTGTTLNGHSITYWNRQTIADGDAMSSATIMPICLAINDNIKAIETMQAATDVIDVFGTYSAFEENSGTLTAEGYLTDKDIIKVLEDETLSAYQTYYQYSSADKAWSFIGSLDPYYSKSDLNNAAGKNINITTDENNIIKINTNDNVEFSSVSSTGFSGTNISGGSKSTTIENLITSAEGGSAANSWLITNISNYISAIDSADMKNIAGEITTATNGSAKTATIKLSGYKTSVNTSNYLSASQSDDYTSSFGLTNNAVSYITEGHAASSWINTNSGNYVKHTDAALVIGDTATLNATTPVATALGRYTTASNYAFGIGFSEDGSKATDVKNKGFAVGDSNSASFNSFVIGHGNKAYGGTDSTITVAKNDRFIIGTNNEITSASNNGYSIGNLNTVSTDNSFAIGILNNIKFKVTKPTFVFGYGNDVYYSSPRYNFVLGSYANISTSSDNFFIIGNGVENFKHNVIEISDDELSFNPPGNKIIISKLGLDVVFTANDAYNGYNLEYIPFRETTLIENDTKIYSNSISAKQYEFFTVDDTNVQGNLCIMEPSSSKSTKFRFQKHEIFTSDWTFYINVHKDYELRMNGAPGSIAGSIAGSSTIPPTARWVSGYSMTESEMGPVYNSATVDTYTITKHTEPTSQYKYVSYMCNYLHPNSYFDITIDTATKTVSVIKGGLGAM